MTPDGTGGTSFFRCRTIRPDVASTSLSSRARPTDEDPVGTRRDDRADVRVRETEDAQCGDERGRAIGSRPVQ